MPACISQKRRPAYGPSTKEVAAEIKARITIPILAEKLFPGWKPDKSCLSPFREEKNPSFSVYENGRRWKDYTSDKGGDVCDFYQEATGCDRKEAFKSLKKMIDGGTIGANPIIRAQETLPEEKKERFHPSLSKPSSEDLDAISNLRAISVKALQIAVDRGFQEAESFPAIALCEGGPDFLAAFGHAFASSVENLVSPVCMAAASYRIPSDALPFFKGKRIRVFVHDDRAGYAAGERWAAQLEDFASDVDGFSFSGLTDSDGSSIGDLNQLLKVDYDCWEANREIIEGVMSFALEREQQ
jgi:hypothetical protein